MFHSLVFKGEFSVFSSIENEIKRMTTALNSFQRAGTFPIGIVFVL